MKRLFLSLMALSFVGASVFAQVPENGGGDQKEANPNAPAFSFGHEVHDFGTVEEGPKYEHSFEFENTGKEPLIISNVRASCGCTTPIWPKEPVLPGQKATIKAVYNSKGRPGNFNKAITISSNASSPTKVLYIKGKVERVPDTGMPEKKPSLMAEPQN